MSAFAYSILSIDGGGIRGVIPCRVLQEIETRTGHPTAELFDLIAGTSTGGILAAGLSIRGDDGRPKHSAEKLLDLYRGEKGKKIFHRSLGALNSAKILWSSLFSHKNIEHILKEEFGDARLKDACTNLLITSYNTQEKTPFYFRSTEAKEEPDIEDFALKDIARATSAAPTYFPAKAMPYKGAFQGKTVNELSLIDGGVFANNPSVLAYVEAISMWKDSPQYKAQFREQTELFSTDRGMAADPDPDNFAPPLLLISLGTGQTKKPYPYRKIKNWGVKWLKPLIDILMQGVSESVHYQMQYLLPPYVDQYGNPTPRYHRLNIQIAREFAEMSDTSDRNLQQLERYAEELIQQHDAEIEEICRQLKQILPERKKRL